MKKLCVILLYVFSFLNTTVAQKLSVESFILAQTDLTAQAEGRKDLNGDACALVKIFLVGDIADVEGNVVKPLMKKNGQTWVFMTQGSKQMQIITQNSLPLMVTFADYSIDKLHGNRTYVLTLAKSCGTSESRQMQTLTIKYSPVTASVLLDNKLVKGSNGVAKTSLPIGQHAFVVACDGYESEEGMVKLKSTAPSNLQITLSKEVASASLSTQYATSVANSADLDVLGGSFCQITAGLKEQLGINYGVEVVKVNNGILKDAGISHGFIIQKINDTNITSLDELLKAVKTASTIKDPVLYIKGMGASGENKYFAVPLPKDRVLTLSALPKKKQEQSSEDKMPSVPSIVSSSKSGTSSNHDDSSSGSVITIPVKDGISIEMVKVEAGSFNMGTKQKPEFGDFRRDYPKHHVTLTNSYYIGKYEVTQELWKVVMDSVPARFKGDKLPVEWVSWYECRNFIKRLDSITGKHFRLPTEAEWEYAARGGKKSRGYRYSGSNTLDDVAWYHSNSGDKTHVVGTKHPNELGIYDMSGNVEEWCQDGERRYSNSRQTNPVGESLFRHVYRGGSWYSGSRDCWVSDRSSDGSLVLYNTLGLRLALSE